MYRTILNEIQTLIAKGNGATEQELKALWNQLSDAITEAEQLNLPPVIKSVCDKCEGTGYLRTIKARCYKCHGTGKI